MSAPQSLTTTSPARRSTRRSDEGITRPYKTYYYSAGEIAGWDLVGSAGSPFGAARSAILRMLRGRYKRAVIHGLAGQVVGTVEATPQGLRYIGTLFLDEVLQ